MRLRERHDAYTEDGGCWCPGALTAALEPERFEELVTDVATNLPPATAFDVLELMGAAARSAPPPEPPGFTDAAIARLARILDVDLEPRPGEYAEADDAEAGNPHVELEIRLRELMDDDEAVSAVGYMLDAGWLPPASEPGKQRVYDKARQRLNPGEVLIDVDPLAARVIDWLANGDPDWEHATTLKPLPGFALPEHHPLAGREAYQCSVCAAIVYPPVVTHDTPCPACEDDSA